MKYGRDKTNSFLSLMIQDQVDILSFHNLIEGVDYNVGPLLSALFLLQIHSATASGVPKPVERDEESKIHLRVGNKEGPA
jgi:hypothetical protein